MSREQEELRLRGIAAKATAFLRDIAEVCLKHGLVIVNDNDWMAIEECTPENLRTLFWLRVGYLAESSYEGEADDGRKRQSELEQWLSDIENGATLQRANADAVERSDLEEFYVCLYKVKAELAAANANKVILRNALEMVRDADDDCGRRIPSPARKRIDAALRVTGDRQC